MKVAQAKHIQFRRFVNIFALLVTVHLFSVSRAGSRRLPHEDYVVNRLLSEDGPFVVLPNYWPRQKANKAAAEAKRAILECHQLVTLDYRRLGVDRLSTYPLAKEFAEDRYLKHIAELFLGGRDVSAKLQYGVTLRYGNSGDGWHQDSKRKGIKALMYLQDTSEKNGPFEILVDYNSSKLIHRPDTRGRTTRYSDAHIEQHVGDSARVRTVSGSAGTVILFDTSNVHRGKTVNERGRISMTNYYDTSLESTSCDKGTQTAEDLSHLDTRNVADVEKKRAEGLKLLKLS